MFDGTPPVRKAAELEKRRTIRRRYEEERAAALERGDLADAYSKATMTSHLTREMVAEARTLLELLGIPVVQAPSEAGRHSEAVGDVNAVRDIYLRSDVADVDRLAFGEPDRDGILDFLCRQRGFAPARVAGALERAFPQTSLC